MFLDLADELLPGLVEGLYLHGSLGFGEWYDGRSDVDYVAVLSHRPDTAATQALGELHDDLAETFPRPPLDGPHVTWEDLARSSYDCPDVPCTLDGAFRVGRVDLHPVTWHELARHAVTVRGPEPARVRVHADEHELRTYAAGTLEDYWTARIEKLRNAPEDQAPGAETVAWFVLGTSRLHHLLATHTLTSKTGAGHYAVAAFGQRWRPLVSEALAVRVTGDLTGAMSGDELAAEVVEFSSMVVETGLRIQV
jgi:hypothetical protein